MSIAEFFEPKTEHLKPQSKIRRWWPSEAWHDRPKPGVSVSFQPWNGKVSIGLQQRGQTLIAELSREEAAEHIAQVARALAQTND
jgi:hypothetical protein